MELIRVVERLPLCDLLAEILEEPLPILDNPWLGIAQCLLGGNRRDVAARPAVAERDPQVEEVIEPPLGLKGPQLILAFDDIEDCFRSLLQ